MYMLREALHCRPDIGKFVFCSESCIPIVPSRQVLRELYMNTCPSSVPHQGNGTNVFAYYSSEDDEGASAQSADRMVYGHNHGSPLTSWINYTNKPTNGYSKQVTDTGFAVAQFHKS